MTTSQFNLDARELHAASKRPSDPPPWVFADANAAVDTTEQAYREAVRYRHDLIREAREVGISWVALSRWTGMHVGTLREIVEG